MGFWDFYWYWFLSWLLTMAILFGIKLVLLLLTEP